MSSLTFGQFRSRVGERERFKQFYDVVHRYIMVFMVYRYIGTFMGYYKILILFLANDNNDTFFKSSMLSFFNYGGY